MWPGNAKKKRKCLYLKYTIHLLSFNVVLTGFYGPVAQSPFTFLSPLFLLTAVITIKHALKLQDSQVWSEYGSGRFSVGHLRQTGRLRRHSNTNCCDWWSEYHADALPWSQRGNALGWSLKGKKRDELKKEQNRARREPAGTFTGVQICDTLENLQDSMTAYVNIAVTFIKRWII